MTVPDADAHHVDPLVVDRLASATAHEVVRRTEVLLDLWAADPPGVLKSGGLGVRDLRSTAAGLNVDDDIAALIIEISWAAGLLAKTGEVGDEWLPTPAYDAWRVASTASRWLTLAAAWLGTPHVPSLVGTTDASGGRVNPLTSDVERIVAPDIRRWVLDDLAAMPPGTAVSTASMVARHEWRRPRRGGRLRDDLVQWTLHEAGALGLVARGAMSSFGGSLLADETADATELLTALLPPPVDHIVLQADLTAVAPGPLRDDLARELALLADVESSGGATVYRFSDRSVRRSLDAGRSSSDIHGFLARISTTPVPQPLTYLVDDVSRKHGAVRVGGATAYVRCDEPSTLDELMASRGLDALRLRRLAPTVVVCGAAPDVVLDRLRTHGLAPALESSEGIVVLTERAARRTGPRAVPTQLAVDPPPASPAVASSIVRALRAAERGADRGAAVRGPGLGADVPRTALSETLDVLHRAVEDKKSVWLGYIDNHGVSGERVVDPVSVSNGRLTAYDHRTDGIRQFAVHRVTGVTLL
jgi:hypothetical protein